MPDYKQDLYKVMKWAYEDEFTLSQEEFNTKITNDDKYANDVYGVMKWAYEDEFKLTPEEFNSKVKKKETSSKPSTQDAPVSKKDSEDFGELNVAGDKWAHDPNVKLQLPKEIEQKLNTDNTSDAGWDAGLKLSHEQKTVKAVEVLTNSDATQPFVKEHEQAYKELNTKLQEKKAALDGQFSESENQIKLKSDKIQEQLQAELKTKTEQLQAEVDNGRPVEEAQKELELYKAEIDKKFKSASILLNKEYEVLQKSYIDAKRKIKPSILPEQYANPAYFQSLNEKYSVVENGLEINGVYGEIPDAEWIDQRLSAVQSGTVLNAHVSTSIQEQEIDGKTYYFLYPTKRIIDGKEVELRDAEVQEIKQIIDKSFIPLFKRQLNQFMGI